MTADETGTGASGSQPLRGICVFCGSRSGVRPAYAKAARSFGEALAAAGIPLVYGGGSIGLMGVLADAVLAGGGQVIGVIPEALALREIVHGGATEMHVVRSMHERKALMADRATAFAALPGGVGTLEEFFEILTWSVLGIHDKPMGLLNASGYFDPLVGMLVHAVDEGFLDPTHIDRVIVDSDPDRLLHALTIAPTGRPSPQVLSKDET